MEICHEMMHEKDDEQIEFKQAESLSLSFDYLYIYIYIYIIYDIVWIFCMLSFCTKYSLFSTFVTWYKHIGEKEIRLSIDFTYTHRYVIVCLFICVLLNIKCRHFRNFYISFSNSWGCNFRLLKNDCHRE